MKRSRCDDAAVAAESGMDGLGKFGSTEELLSAYNALQSEFTKRCQLVKELQARLDATDAQAEDNAAPRSSAQCGGADGTIAECGEQAIAEVSADAERAVMTDGADEADYDEARIAEALATPMRRNARRRSRACSPLWTSALRATKRSCSGSERSACRAVRR